jgi:hypothetical protein
LECQRKQLLCGFGSVQVSSEVTMMSRVKQNVWLTVLYCVLSLCMMLPTIVMAQEKWASIPSLPRSADEPDLHGAVINAVSICNNRRIDARVVISGARQSGIYLLGFWVRNLYDVMPESELWPYMGPDLGKEAENDHMINLIIQRDKKTYKFNLILNMLSPGNYPKGTAEENDYNELFNAYMPPDKRMYSLIRFMADGFDAATATIGIGVFKHPLEIRFIGNGIEKPLREVVEFVGEPKRDRD